MAVVEFVLIKFEFKYFLKNSAEKDRMYIYNFDFASLNFLIITSACVYGFLNILDGYSTFLVLYNVPFSYEMNPFAKDLFENGNFIRPILSKFSVFSAIVTTTFIPVGRWRKFEIYIRIIKLGTLLGLLVMLPIMSFIVSHNFVIFLSYT